MLQNVPVKHHDIDFCSSAAGVPPRLGALEQALPPGTLTGGLKPSEWDAPPPQALLMRSDVAA